MADESTAPTTDATDIDPRVIEKIQKLLALGKSGVNAAEAELAAARAQELAMKHNLDIAFIEASQGSKANRAEEQERVKEDMKGKAMYKWQRTLAKYVAEAHFCYHVVKSEQVWRDRCWKVKGKTYTEEDRERIREEQGNNAWWAIVDSDDCKEMAGKYTTSHRHVFVGRKGNVITAQLMYNYLTSVIEDNVPITSNKERLSANAMIWKEGTADAICESLAARRQDLIKEHDAKVRAEAELIAAERKRAAEERAAKAPKILMPNEELEQAAAFQDHAAQAWDASGPVPEAEEPDRPEVDEGDTWSPEEPEVEEPAMEAGTTMVLASVFDESEREANYELANGYKPGTLARWRREAEEAREQRARELEERAKQAAEQGMDKVEAPVQQAVKQRTAAQRRRDAEAAAASRRRWARESAADNRKWMEQQARRNSSAYKDGQRFGKTVGLDTQVAARGKTAKTLKG